MKPIMIIIIKQYLYDAYIISLNLKKAPLKRWVFSSFLKVFSSCILRRSVGNLFQILGAITEKEIILMHSSNSAIFCLSSKKYDTIIQVPQYLN